MTSTEVSAVVGTRARIVLWHAEGRMKKDLRCSPGCHGRRWTRQNHRYFLGVD
ncbi:MAG TPA: hypothetical protein VFY84_06960 [Jiangellales bacterium]|nr:hypothetical protein [Jiangellales bacterium]